MTFDVTTTAWAHSTRVNQLKNAWVDVPLMTEEIEQRESKGTMLRYYFALERYGNVSFPSFPLSSLSAAVVSFVY